ncbi:MAG: hypothetical protein R3D67_15935 [Hyphomicrobiaceae bacterium]
MLPRIVLFLLQVAAAWFIADPIKSALGTLVARPYDIFIYAVIYALIVFLMGYAGALVLKNVRVPSLGTLVACLVLAALGAGLTLVDAIRVPLDSAVPLLSASHKVYALAGALIGYLIKR